MEYFAAWIIFVIIGINAMITYVGIKGLYLARRQDKLLEQMGLLGVSDRAQIKR